MAKVAEKEGAAGTEGNLWTLGPKALWPQDPRDP